MGREGGWVGCAEERKGEKVVGVNGEEGGDESCWEGGL